MTIIIALTRKIDLYIKHLLPFVFINELLGHETSSTCWELSAILDFEKQTKLNVAKMAHATIITQRFKVIMNYITVQNMLMTHSNFYQCIYRLNKGF